MTTGTLSVAELGRELQLIVDGLRKWNQREGIVDEVIPAAPATAKALDALLSERGPLPPSYVNLLEIHDGIRRVYRLDGDILSSAYRGEHDQQFEFCVDLSNVIFFAMDNDGSAACFDVSSRNGTGEMEVLEVFNYREIARFRSLSEFIVNYRLMLQSWLSGEAFESVGRPEVFRLKQ